MSNLTQSSLTELLNRWQSGEASAFDKVQSQVMRDLEKIAESRMRGEYAATIAPMDLLQEALLRVMDKTELDKTDDATWKNRAHFFATMSLHMRAILVDRARARNADKRGGGAIHLTLSEIDAEESIIAELISLDQTLNQLAAIDPRGAEIMHLTYFAGLTRDEIAEVTKLSVPTIDRELRFARAWLNTELGRQSI
jgi:RNA polymerase sigma factor (TIGR02999 family)